MQHLLYWLIILNIFYKKYLFQISHLCYIVKVDIYDFLTGCYFIRKRFLVFAQVKKASWMILWYSKAI